MLVYNDYIYLNQSPHNHYYCYLVLVSSEIKSVYIKIYATWSIWCL